MVDSGDYGHLRALPDGSLTAAEVGILLNTIEHATGLADAAASLAIARTCQRDEALALLRQGAENGLHGSAIREFLAEYDGDGSGRKEAAK